VISALADHLDSGRPAVTAAAGAVEAGDRIEGAIRQALELYVRPGVARDGGDVLFERFDADSGVLWIRMQGACGGCPSARVTLKSGVERIVRQHVPEVARVEETTDGAEAASEPPSRGAGARLADWARALTGRTASAPGTVFTHAGRDVRRA
jgi:Fe-S cluster biogenesis protein NfuA